MTFTKSQFKRLLLIAREGANTTPLLNVDLELESLGLVEVQTAHKGRFEFRRYAVTALGRTFLNHTPHFVR